jgi:cyanuric acid amidohydrolase
MEEPREAIEVSAATVMLEYETDDRGLAQLLADGRVVPDEICAITGKTEGHGDDETSRAAAIASVRRFLGEHSSMSDAQIDHIPMVLSCGGVGILAPNLVVYSRRRVLAAPDPAPSLVIGCAHSEAVRPEWMGRRAMADAVADGVRRAAADAGIDARDAEYVMTKSRALYPEDIEEARGRGVEVSPYPPELLVPKSSGCAALGVRWALEGIEPPADAEIGLRGELWSSRASSSCGREDPRTSVVLFGNSTAAAGHLRIGQATLEDLLDIGALRRALTAAGAAVPEGPLPEAVRRRIVAVYAKVGTPEGGRLRGRRQVQETENPFYQAELKAAVAGMLAAELQDTVLYISGTAMHQGPPGGGSVAVVYDHSPHL